MATDYITSDGRTFSDSNNSMASHQAREHQASLDGSGMAVSKRSSWTVDQRWKQYLDFYNAGEWDKMLVGNLLENTPYEFQMKAMRAVAYAKTGDYLKAFEAEGFEWIYTSHGSDFFDKVGPIAIQSAKEAWAKKHGRTMTEADLTKLHIDFLERKIAEWAKGIKYGNYNASCGWLESFISDWEKLTGRKLTKEDEIRLIGEPFPKVKSSSRSRSTSTSGGSILFNIIGAIVVAIIGFNILGWLGLIGGAVGGFFLGKWLSGKLIGKILLIALLVIVGGTFIISKLPSKPAPATENTQKVNEE